MGQKALASESVSCMFCATTNFLSARTLSRRICIFMAVLSPVGALSETLVWAIAGTTSDTAITSHADFKRFICVVLVNEYSIDPGDIKQPLCKKVIPNNAINPPAPRRNVLATLSGGWPTGHYRGGTHKRHTGRKGWRLDRMPSGQLGCRYAGTRLLNSKGVCSLCVGWSRLIT